MVSKKFLNITQRLLGEVDGEDLRDNGLLDYVREMCGLDDSLEKEVLQRLLFSKLEEETYANIANLYGQIGLMDIINELEKFGCVSFGGKLYHDADKFFIDEVNEKINFFICPGQCGLDGQFTVKTMVRVPRKFIPLDEGTGKTFRKLLQYEMEIVFSPSKYSLLSICYTKTANDKQVLPFCPNDLYEVQAVLRVKKERHEL